MNLRNVPTTQHPLQVWKWQHDSRVGARWGWWKNAPTWFTISVFGLYLTWYVSYTKWSASICLSCVVYITSYLNREIPSTSIVHELQSVVCDTLIPFKKHNISNMTLGSFMWDRDRRQRKRRKNPKRNVCHSLLSISYGINYYKNGKLIYVMVIWWINFIFCTNIDLDPEGGHGQSNLE